MKTVLIVIGTRPEAIKMYPVIRALKKKKQIKTAVAITSQHKELLYDALKELGIVAEYDLDLFVRGRTLVNLNSTLLARVGALLDQLLPDLVLVHGDTATAFSAATAAFFSGIPVGHVEAGLRSWNMEAPFPEEYNRSAISLISQLDFAPTEIAEETLLRMGKPRSSVFLTGNTVIDTMRFTVKKEFTHPFLSRTEGNRRIFLTTHRRENLGIPQREIFEAIRRLTDAFPDLFVFCPLHLNPEVRKAAETVLGRSNPRIFLSEPVGVTECHNLLARSTLVLTDSGGIQEEASALGIPVVILRNTTERQELVACGAAVLAGCEKTRIFDVVSHLLSSEEAYSRMAVPRTLYGDGKASERICEAVSEYLMKTERIP